MKKAKKTMPFRKDLNIYQGVPDPEKDTRKPTEKLEHEHSARRAKRNADIAVDNLNRAR